MSRGPATSLMRLRATLFALAIVFLGLAGAVTAPAAQADNAAVAINEEDGSSIFEFAFDVRKVAGDVVDEQNTAVAYSSCESCRTIAISIQIVLVVSDPNILTPENVAVAVNEDCTLCETMAAAYQFVVGGEGLELSEDGLEELDEIREEIAELLEDSQEMSLDKFKRKLERLISEIREVLDRELVPIESDDDDGDDDDGDDDEDDGDDDEDFDDDQSVTTTGSTTIPTTTTSTSTSTAPTTTTPTTTTAPTTTTTTTAPTTTTTPTTTTPATTTTAP